MAWFHLTPSAYFSPLAGVHFFKRSSGKCHEIKDFRTFKLTVVTSRKCNVLCPSKKNLSEHREPGSYFRVWSCTQDSQDHCNADLGFSFCPPFTSSSSAERREQQVCYDLGILKQSKWIERRDDDKSLPKGDKLNAMDCFKVFIPYTS